MKDLIEILRNVPKGTKLYSTLHGDIYFDHIDVTNIYSIKCYGNSSKFCFTKDGKHYHNYDGECVLFPSKEQRDWSKFIKPFQNGDVISSCVGNIAIFSHYSSTNAIVYHCVMTNNDIIIEQDTGIGYHHNCILASQKEKELLYNKLQKKGYFWNDKTNSLEKYKFNIGDKIQDKTTKQIYSIYDIEHDKYKICKNIPGYLYAEYQDNYELYQEKFDITTLKPYDKVLVRFNDSSVWEPQLFSYLDINLKHNGYKFVISGLCSIPQCIPYEGNEHLIGTNNECDEYYKTWE